MSVHNSAILLLLRKTSIWGKRRSMGPGELRSLILELATSLRVKPSCVVRFSARSPRIYASYSFPSVKVFGMGVNFVRCGAAAYVLNASEISFLRSATVILALSVPQGVRIRLYAERVRALQLILLSWACPKG